VRAYQRGTGPCSGLSVLNVVAICLMVCEDLPTHPDSASAIIGVGVGRKRRTRCALAVIWWSWPLSVSWPLAVARRLAKGASLLGPFGGTDPRDLLSSLAAVSASVTELGTATTRGVEVTCFRVNIDPAKVVSRVPQWQRAGFRAFVESIGAATTPVEVWVDQHNLVRRVRISLHLPTGPGASTGVHITQSVDFYDFGVPVRVSAPPAAEVANMSEFANGSVSRSILVGSSGPPGVSGTLSPARVEGAQRGSRRFHSSRRAESRP
jgi:hypothetical protein